MVGPSTIVQAFWKKILLEEEDEDEIGRVVLLLSFLHTGTTGARHRTWDMEA
jgi:hypothetical protein